MAKFCSNCGAKMDSDASFCVNCGSSTNGEVKSTVDNSTGEVTRNGMATAGFVLSFFVPLLGLIFSIIGIKRSGNLNGTGRGLAIAGLIISIIHMVINVFISLAYYSVFISELISELS